MEAFAYLRTWVYPYWQTNKLEMLLMRKDEIDEALEQASAKITVTTGSKFSAISMIWVATGDY